MGRGAQGPAAPSARRAQAAAGPPADDEPSLRQGEMLRTRSHKHEHPLENATDKSIGKFQ